VLDKEDQVITLYDLEDILASLELIVSNTPLSKEEFRRKLCLL